MEFFDKFVTAWNKKFPGAKIDSKATHQEALDIVESAEIVAEHDSEAISAEIDSKVTALSEALVTKLNSALQSQSSDFTSAVEGLSTKMEDVATKVAQHLAGKDAGNPSSGNDPSKDIDKKDPKKSKDEDDKPYVVEVNMSDVLKAANGK